MNKDEMVKDEKLDEVNGGLVRGSSNDAVGISFPRSSERVLASFKGNTEKD